MRKDRRAKPSGDGLTGFVTFLADLERRGEVAVDHAREPTLAEIQRLKPDLELIEKRARLDAPGSAPPFSMATATWAAVIFYRACQFLVHREVGADEIARTLARPCPEPASSPATAYSADLVLRNLPELMALARGLAPGDPLVASLIELARRWPLSSVGIPGAAPRRRGAEDDRGGDGRGTAPLEAIISHPALLLLYADRIIARGDTARLDDPAVRDAVEGRLGLHRGLAPGIAAALDADAAAGAAAS